MPENPPTTGNDERNDSPGARLLGDLVLSGDPQRMVTMLEIRLSPYLRLSGISCRLDHGMNAGLYEAGEPCESMLVLSVSSDEATLGEIAWYRPEPFAPEEEELLYRTTRLLARALGKLEKSLP
ncbi:MAG: hypothetical protein WED00_08580 [Aquisalimonadaceae bacterium]